MSGALHTHRASCHGTGINYLRTRVGYLQILVNRHRTLVNQCTSSILCHLSSIDSTTIIEPEVIADAILRIDCSTLGNIHSTIRRVQVQLTLKSYISTRQQINGEVSTDILSLYSPITSREVNGSTPIPKIQITDILVRDNHINTRTTTITIILRQCTIRHTCGKVGIIRHIGKVE